LIIYLARFEIESKTRLAFRSGHTEWRRLVVVEFSIGSRSVKSCPWKKCISNLDVTGFAESFSKFIATTKHFSKIRDVLTSTFDVVAPTRKYLTTLDSYASAMPMIEQVARDAILG